MNAAGQAHFRRAEKHYRPLLPFLQRFHDEDMPLAEIAERLNAKNFRTYAGSTFTRSNVSELIRRCRERGLIAEPQH